MSEQNLKWWRLDMGLEGALWSSAEGGRRNAILYSGSKQVELPLSLTLCNLKIE